MSVEYQTGEHITPRLTNRLCVITPVHQDCLSDADWLSIQHGEKHLSSYDRFIIAPIRLRHSTIHRTLGRQFNWVWFMDHHFESIQSYNHLLLSSNFYEQFASYSYMLIYQLDALIFAPTIDLWLNKGYSYVGAPWLNNEEEINQTKQLFKGVGNGGFSLRKVDHLICVLKSDKKLYSFVHYVFRFYPKRTIKRMLKNCIRYFRTLETFNTAKHNSFYNEDKIISYAAFRFDFFKVPTPQEASQFAFEENPRQLYAMNNQTLPLGCHAWNKIDPAFYEPFIIGMNHETGR